MNNLDLADEIGRIRSLAVIVQAAAEGLDDRRMVNGFALLGDQIEEIATTIIDGLTATDQAEAGEEAEA